MRRNIGIFLLALAPMIGCGIDSVHAAVVVWNIDTTQSYIRLNIPDQDLPLNEIDPPVGAGVRDYNGVDPLGGSMTSAWTDAGGRRSAVQGTISSDYTEGTSIQFTAGSHAMGAVEAGSFVPNPVAWDGTTYTNTTGAPAAFAAQLGISAPGTPPELPLGVISLRGINYDLIGNVSVSPSGGGWTGNNAFNVGILAGAFADALSLVGNLRLETLDLGVNEVNTGNLTITNLGGGLRRLTIPVSIDVNFDVNGVVLEASAAGVIVATATVSAPVPQLVNSRPYHDAFPVESKVDTSVSLIQRGANPQLAQLSNIISSSQGINGIVLDFDNLNALGDISLEYKMSPQLVFATPISGWAGAPAPTSTTLLPNAGDAGSDRVLIKWPNGTLVNRYLCIKITLPGGSTIELYVGHLIGETTGGDGTTFSVAFGSDLIAIRAALATNVNASSRVDIDKNSLVQVADIIAMRTNTAKQLSQITVPANP